MGITVYVYISILLDVPVFCMLMSQFALAFCSLSASKYLSPSTISDSRTVIRAVMHKRHSSLTSKSGWRMNN